MISIIGYGCGNLRSLQNAFKEIGQKTKVIKGAVEIKQAEKIVLPGVGSFGQAMENIRKQGIGNALVKASEKKPFLGICLGLQILFEESEESPGVDGLGILKGEVKKFTAAKKIPQMGWNKVSLDENKLFNGLSKKEWFYFANSYYAKPANWKVVSGKGFYGEEFCAAVQKGKLFATQFHPEKSGKNGLKVLKNFAGVK